LQVVRERRPKRSATRSTGAEGSAGLRSCADGRGCMPAHSTARSHLHEGIVIGLVPPASKHDPRTTKKGGGEWTTRACKMTSAGGAAPRAPPDVSACVEARDGVDPHGGARPRPEGGSICEHDGRKPRGAHVGCASSKRDARGSQPPYATATDKQPTQTKSNKTNRRKQGIEPTAAPCYRQLPNGKPNRARTPNLARLLLTRWLPPAAAVPSPRCCPTSSAGRPSRAAPRRSAVAQCARHRAMRAWRWTPSARTERGRGANVGGLRLRRRQ
jgi:hypothetical protein